MSKHQATQNVQFAACAASLINQSEVTNFRVLSNHGSLTGSRKNPSGLLTVTAIFLCGLAVPASAQNPIPPRIGPEKHFTVPPHAVNRVVLQTEPEAACNLHVAGDNDPAKTMTLYANIEGYVQFHFTPNEETEDVPLQLDCATAGAVSTHPVHLHIGSSPTADMPAPMTSIPAPKGSRVLPALTDESARQLSDQEIVALGYSPRPDPAESPEAYTKWLETYSRPITMLPPQSVRQSAIRHTLPSVEAGFFSSSHWSGYVAQSVPSSYIRVNGWWHVPNNGNPESPSINQRSSFWVGLDGYGLSDLVQAGTEQSIVNFGAFGFIHDNYAWTEVVPNQAEQQQFSVNPDDYMHVTVWVGDSTGAQTPLGHTAWFSIVDQTQSQGGIYSTPLAGTSFSGSTAEWIMERPCVANCFGPASGWVFPDLAHYGPVIMTDAWVSTPTSGTKVTNYSTAENVRINMYNNNYNFPDNNWLSTVYSTSTPTEMQFLWRNYH